MKNKQKIAVLGGGMASLTAIFELTNQPDWQEHYDITLYQMGWRVGGKTSTGRGTQDRIEEVGIHILQGWYKQVFKILQESYAYCQEHQLFPPNFPFRTWQDAFEKENATLLTQWFEPKGKWISRNLIFPPNDLNPADESEEPVSITLEKVLYLLYEVLIGVPYQVKQRFSFLDKNFVFQNIAQNLLKQALDALQNAKNNPQNYQFISRILKECQNALAFFCNLFPKDNEHIYWLRIMGEFVLVASRGFFEDIYDPATDTMQFNNVNHVDFRDWLRSKGLSKTTLESAIVRFLYTGTFANLAGGEGLIGAGTAMNFLVASIGYKGSFVWKFKAGTGDTLIAPIYLALKHRGVSFKFFHKTLQVHHSDTGEIERISMARQVTLTQNEYQPLIQVKNIWAWTSAPLYDQIVPAQAKRLQEENINLESSWSTWQNAEILELKKGEDFDYVVLGIPIAVLGGEQGICREIIDAKPAWKRMYENVQTTATQSIQVWFEKDYQDLGMNLKEWGIETTPNLVTYASPIYSWIDMSLVLDQESWKATQRPKMLIYYCGSVPDADNYPDFGNASSPEQAKENLIATMQQWLQDNMGYFWKNTQNIEFPQGFDFNILFDTDYRTNPTPEQKLRSQYFRANIEPSDRYTLSVPNSGFHRLKTDQSGYANMVLAGDWIDFGVNVGYIEGAVLSGRQAGKALLRILSDKVDTTSEQV